MTWTTSAELQTSNDPAQRKCPDFTSFAGTSLSIMAILGCPMCYPAMLVIVALAEAGSEAKSEVPSCARVCATLPDAP
jgi:hypothetical protein